MNLDFLSGLFDREKPSLSFGFHDSVESLLMHDLPKAVLGLLSFCLGAGSLSPRQLHVDLTGWRGFVALALGNSR
tara:strand:+ start:341 stop:565 length:225 start_codon:yes stop_codon:yes gene_type:complete